MEVGVASLMVVGPASQREPLETGKGMKVVVCSPTRLRTQEGMRTVNLKGIQGLEQAVQSDFDSKANLFLLEQQFAPYRCVEM